MLRCGRTAAADEGTSSFNETPPPSNLQPPPSNLVPMEEGLPSYLAFQGYEAYRSLFSFYFKCFHPVKNNCKPDISQGSNCQDSPADEGTSSFKQAPPPSYLVLMEEGLPSYEEAVAVGQEEEGSKPIL